jgi:type II secretory pathway predicted ATPase ExeA
MFLEFYQLREQPFGVTPDPRFLYFSPGHREALASLFYGIETGRGFLSLVAEPGMGKTTLFFQLLQRWKGHIHSAFLFQTQCDSRELLRYLLDDLGLKSDGEDIVRMHSELNDFLFRESKAGRRVVVFIDEAQNLSETVLETVRLLSDFEAPDRKLMQIILAGQPGLEARLSRPSLAQLRQRIAIQSRLDPLPPDEVVRYVHHRLRVAGHKGAHLFTPGALGLIAEYSRGIPRVVNILCFNALSLGCAEKQNQIDAKLIKEAAKDMSLDLQAPKLTARQEPLPQAARRDPWLLRPISFSWPKDGIFRRRFFQVTTISLLLCSLAIFVGAHSRFGALQHQDAHRQNSESKPATEVPTLPNTRAEAAQAQVSTAEVISQNASGDNMRRSFTYVVQPKDTLRSLCVSVLGRYDGIVLDEIRELNPELKSPDHIAVGQEIRLPMSEQK